MSGFSLSALLNPKFLFSIQRGVHPETHKGLTSDQPIETMPIPSLIRVPLQMHIGAPAEPLVNRGDHVLKGQLIGKSRGMISANVHAPTSGHVIAVGPFVAPHPSGLPVNTVTIKPDGEDTWGPHLSRLRPETASAEDIAARVSEAGIVGMGGATFPSSVKLTLGQKYKLDTLIINAAECEPYLTADDLLLREHSEDVADGAAIMAKALGVPRIIIAIESNKPEAIAAMRRFREILDAKFEVKVVPTLYPMGSEKHLVQAVLGKETPARALTAELGVVVHNASTARAVHAAVRYGEPLISRIVTVSGKAVARQANLRVLVGTPVASIIEHCGGFVGEPERLLLGGPMMGLPIENTRVPVVKGTNGILALTQGEAQTRAPMPCIRCASCVQVCPCGLTPFEMNLNIQAGDLPGAVEVGLMDCISCGSCSYACPSNIPLVQGFSYAKGKLAEIDSRKQLQEETKRLTAARTAREAAIMAAKRAAMAKRKAEMAAKKAAESNSAAANEIAP